MRRPFTVAVEEAFRDEWGQVVATLIRLTGDWDLAEECAADAFAVALERWPRDGVPRRPGAWLTTTARNRAIDRLRRDAVGWGTCCHPAPAFEARVAPTLWTLAGPTTEEFASAFVVPAATLRRYLAGRGPRGPARGPVPARSSVERDGSMEEEP